MITFHFLQISAKEHLNLLSDGCTLSDMLTFDDLDKDNRIAINELYSAFSKLYSKFCSLFTSITLYLVINPKGN